MRLHPKNVIIGDFLLNIVFSTDKLIKSNLGGTILINNKEVPIFCVTDFSIEDEQGILTKML